MKPWLYGFLSCQECSGELALGKSLESEDDDLVTGTVECVECELSWPVLGGVPFLLNEPGAYLASYRESVLTTLVEHGAASSHALHLVDEFCQGYSAEPLRFSDDWTAHESGKDRPSLATGTAALEAFGALVEADRNHGLAGSVLNLLGSQRYDSILEVGPGAGGLSRLLVDRCDTLVLVDLSLRSLLCSRAVASTGNAEVGMVLGDVAALEMASDCASAIVAANVVDLVDDAEAFLVSLSRWLVRQGALILTTPDPSLGTDNDDTLRDMMEVLEYKIKERKDGIPWLRVHHSRYSQIYWMQALRASLLN